MISGLQMSRQNANDASPTQVELRLDVVGLAIKEAG
jgi:hypothetical protein